MFIQSKPGAHEIFLVEFCLVWFLRVDLSSMTFPDWFFRVVFFRARVSGLVFPGWFPDFSGLFLSELGSCYLRFVGAEQAWMVQYGFVCCLQGTAGLFVWLAHPRGGSILKA